jgi:hypothetical protein
MWDDKINKNIRDAADQYHPAYDENAWEKMELLLNEHLPVENKKKKRYFYFFVTLAVLLLAGSLFGLYKHYSPAANTPGNDVAANKTGNSIVKTEAKRSLPSDQSQPSLENHRKPVPSNGTGINSKTDNGNSKKFASTTATDKISQPFNTLQNTNSANAVRRQMNLTSKINNTGEDQAPLIENFNKAETNGTKSDDHERDMEKQSTVSNVPALKQEIVQLKKDTATAKGFAKNTKEKKQGLNKKFNNNFSVGFSAGPDISSTGLNHIGKVSINYGIGVSYNLSGRFTLHTGFYVAEKLYSAGKNDYQLPAGSTSNYLYYITANCKVYEIPMTVSYNFDKHKSHQWFVGGGLSSYLMKKESYEYYYKYPSGYIDSKSWSISNQNQHYFAILDISGGYQYSFNKKLSLTTEPYLKIPLVGVGAGKVKLHSAGILFTLHVKPFYNR